MSPKRFLATCASASLVALAAGCGPREPVAEGLQPRADITYPVGVSTVNVNEFITAEVWYPAVAGSVGTETYDVKTFTPYILQTMLTANVPSTYTYDAARDAAVSPGKFPVVLFSHGFAGFRVQSTFLTSYLASKGMIVIAPEHPSRDLAAALTGGTFETNDPQVHLLESLDYLVKDTTLFSGHVDATRVAAVGHSAGGGTVLAVAADARIDGYVSMASGLIGAAASTKMPAKPSFFLAGSVDSVVPSARTKAAFDAAPSPSAFWTIDGVGHNGFDDLCTFGNGLGIIGVALASGLEKLLEMQPQMRTLGEDGCVPPARPVAQTFPVIRDAVTTWLQGLFAGKVVEPVVPKGEKIATARK